jgi:hypothetical protein
MRVGDLVRGSLYIIYLSQFQVIFLINILSDAELEGRLDEMEELDEFEPDELPGGLVFSEDEEDNVDPEEIDDW